MKGSPEGYALSEKKSQKLWVWKAWDRATGQLVDWECGGRDRATFEQLLKRVSRWRPRLYCADGWEAYAELIPQGRLYVGKDQTHGIDDLRQLVFLNRRRLPVWADPETADLLNATRARVMEASAALKKIPDSGSGDCGVPGSISMKYSPRSELDFL